mgnify:CR=1 FL=1
MNIDKLFGNACYLILFLQFIFTSLFFKYSTQIKTCSQENIVFIYLKNTFWVLLFFATHSLSSRIYIKETLKKWLGQKMERIINTFTTIIFLNALFLKWTEPCKPFILAEISKDYCFYLNIFWIIVQVCLTFFIYKARKDNSYCYFYSKCPIDNCSSGSMHPIFLCLCLGLWICCCKLTFQRVVLNTLFSTYCIVGGKWQNQDFNLLRKKNGNKNE